MTQRISASEPDPRQGQPPAPTEQPDADPGFFKTHFGNPEKDEIYGNSANDYETEPEQIKDEKRAAGQAIWFLGAAALLIFILYALPQMW